MISPSTLITVARDRKKVNAYKDHSMNCRETRNVYISPMRGLNDDAERDAAMMRI